MLVKKVVEQPLPAPAILPHKSKKRNKALLIFLLTAAVGLILCLAFGIYAVVIPGIQILNSVKAIGDQINVLATSVASKDLTQFENLVAEVNTEFAKVNEQLARFDFLQNYSFTKGYFQNIQVLRQLNTQLSALIDDAYPDLADTLKSFGYKVEESDEISPEDTEIGKIITELPRVISLYEKYEPQLIEVMATMQQFDTDFIPQIGGGQRYAQILAKVQDMTEDFPTSSAKLKDLMRVAPDLLGASTPVNYLVVLTNEKELRSSGGLITAYAVMTLDKGEITGEIETIDMWDLHNDLAAIGRHPGYRDIYGQAALMARGCGPQSLRPQDVGIYPDLNLTMDMFTDYYDLAARYMPKKYSDYQHVVMFNTYFASDLVSFVDPITDPDTGRELTEENLAHEIYAETSSQEFDPSIRKSFIGVVAGIAQEKFKELSSDQMLDVAVKMLNTVIQKNVALQSKNPEVQTFIDEFGLNGKIENNFAGDYFQLAEAQNCALKANFYIRDTVTQNINIQDNGQIDKKINVQWRNEHVFNPATDETIINNGLRYLYRAWVRVMAPKDTKFTASDGYQKSGIVQYRPVTYFDTKMQKQVSDNVIRFDHRRSKETDPIRYHDLNVAYTLPTALNYDADTGYQMLIQKHPGKRDEYYKINITYKGETTSTEFTLDRDKVISFRNGVLTISDYPHKLDEYTKLVQQIKDISF